jgi:hypothetical protein
MSFTKVMFFHNNKCCYINACDVLLYQYILKNYKQQEKIPDNIFMNLMTDYIKLWVKYIEEPYITNVMIVDKVNNLDIASTCTIIIDNSTKRFVHNDIKLDYNMIYKQFIADNNFFDTDYDDDEIDYTEKKSNKKYPDFEFGKWPDYNMDDLKEKSKVDFNFDKWREEVKQNEIKETTRRTMMNEKLKKKYGEKYISKEYLNSKLNSANLKSDFYWEVLKILADKNKIQFFACKLATQQYKVYRYNGDNYHKCPYRYNVIYVKKEEYRINSTYAFEEKELRIKNIVNDHIFGVKSYEVIVDDGNDYYSSHVHDIKIEYMNVDIKKVDTDMFYELMTEVINCWNFL